MVDDGPLDPFDPRFDGAEAGAAGATPRAPRRLVPSKGPGASAADPRVRRLHLLVRVVAVAGLAAVVLVFFSGLDPGSGVEVVGAEADVRAAVADRPRRVCYRGANPCAWVTVVEGRILALNTNGPLPAEYGRQGVGWCPSSGGFGSNATGSRYDAAGRVVRGPAFRSLDRFAVLVDARGRVVIRFADLAAGIRAEQVRDPVPARGEDCETIPFDRDPDLVVRDGQP